jgi:predicted ArsR family transcriptional regulator
MAHGGARPGAGRPKGALNTATKDIRALAQQYGPQAIATLVELMLQGENQTVRKSAADSLLDRGFGRPGQHIEVDADVKQDVLVTAINLVGKKD